MLVEVRTLQDWTGTDLFFQALKRGLTVLSSADWLLYVLHQQIG